MAPNYEQVKEKLEEVVEYRKGIASKINETHHLISFETIGALRNLQINLPKIDIEPDILKQIQDFKVEKNVNNNDEQDKNMCKQINLLDILIYSKSAVQKIIDDI